MRGRRHVAWVVPVLFLLSGVAALADEVVWFKYLNLTFGSTTSATATLLAVFMGGLALGSFVFGRIAPRLTRPAVTYALLEAGVGLFALATPALFSLVDRGYVFAYRHLGEGPGTLLFVRFALSALVLLPPTFLMGATFPVLARQVEAEDRPGRRSGLLYGINTAGAVAGTALTGFLTIPAIGLSATLAAAGALSLLAALLAAVAASLPSWGALAPRAAGAELERPERLYLAIAFLTGLGAMADEVLWTRILVLHLGSSVYAFSLMLAVYLAGLVLGSLTATAVTAREIRTVLVFAQLLLGAVLLAQVFAFGVFSDALVASAVHVVHAHTWGGVLVSEAIATALYLLPPTFLFGFTFSLLLRVASRSGDSAPRSAGAVYASNTLGAIGGSLLAAFAAIPLVGSQTTLLLAGALAVGVAIALEPRRRSLRWAAAAYVLLALLPRRDGVILSAGVLSLSPKNLLYYREGTTATVALKRADYPRNALSLELNGVNVAGTLPDLLLTQTLQAHLPLSFVESPRTVLHIGFGSGGTAYSVSRHPVSDIRVVEISPEVLATSDRFLRSVNHGVLLDPRVHATINDGRNFVLASPRRFDAILSDSIHPRYAGNGSLYTEDYFRLCAKRLAPGGVVSMWLPMYSVLPENFRSIVRAFRDVFPNVTIWYAHTAPSPFTIVLATPGRTVDLAAFARRLAYPAVREDLAHVRAEDPADVLSFLLLAPDDVTRWVANTPPHTDDLPLVEYESGRTMDHTGTWYATFADLVARRSRIQEFVTGLSPDDPLSQRVLERFEAARSVLDRQVRELAARVEKGGK